MSITGRELRDVMGEFATGVTIVTARNPADNSLFGFTANAVTSVSLDPPLVLVCVGKNRYAHEILAQADYFGINILSHTQDEVAKRFAGRDEGRFENLQITESLSSGIPFITGANGKLECQKTEMFEGGDHSIIIGRVNKIEHTPENAPLLFFRGAFCFLGHSGD